MLGPSSLMTLEMLARDKRAQFEEEAAREWLLASARQSIVREPLSVAGLLAWLRPAPRTEVLCCPQAA